jgi:hypothetical protein
LAGGDQAVDPATNRTICPYGIPADHQNNL